MNMSRTFYFYLYSLTCITSLSAELTPQARENGFVYLDEIDPTIQVSLRYATKENFLGTPVDGYSNAARVIITKQAAKALKMVQDELRKQRYSLVIYDAYRPQRAVNHFIRWSTDATDQIKKDQYFPRVDKERVFELGYVAKQSGHTRGSTVDLSIIKVGDTLHNVVEYERTLSDGATVKFLDDGTVDMWTSFDLLDAASHENSDLIPKKHLAMRNYLRTIMEKYGFTVSPREWWHFRLRSEPFPENNDSSYFDFEVA